LLGIRRMKVLEFFVIRAAIPFACLGVALVLLGAAIFGLVQVWRGLRARPLNRIRLLAGVALLFVVGLATTANLIWENSVEFNPFITAADLEGVWNDGSAALNLNSDGSYTCSGAGSCSKVGAVGRWTRDGDFLLRFTRASDGQVLIQRVVSTERGLRLTNEVGDLDMWDGVLTFTHRVSVS